MPGYDGKGPLFIGGDQQNTSPQNISGFYPALKTTRVEKDRIRCRIKFLFG